MSERAVANRIGQLYRLVLSFQNVTILGPLAEQPPPPSKKDREERWDIDMSPRAVAARVEDIRQLYRLCMSLGKAGRDAGLAPPIDRAKR